jgi:predicted permease
MFQTFYHAGENGFWVFVLCTLVLGAGAAYITGRAIAETWRPLWQVVVYALLLGLVVRFMHFALFDEVLISARNYAVDCAVLLAAGLIGYALARRQQMAEQYGWPGEADAP